MSSIRPSFFQGAIFLYSSFESDLLLRQYFHAQYSVQSEQRSLIAAILSRTHVLVDPVPMYAHSNV